MRWRLHLSQDALKKAGIVYTMSISGRRALFCRDPDGNAIEIIEAGHNLQAVCYPVLVVSIHEEKMWRDIFSLCRFLQPW